VSVVSSSVVDVFFSVVDDWSESLDLADGWSDAVGASSLAPQALRVRRIPAMTGTMRMRRMRFSLAEADEPPDGWGS
jgi:hypothetical protein